MFIGLKYCQYNITTSHNLKVVGVLLHKATLNWVSRQILDGGLFYNSKKGGCSVEIYTSFAFVTMMCVSQCPSFIHAIQPKTVESKNRKVLDLRPNYKFIQLTACLMEGVQPPPRTLRI